MQKLILLSVNDRAHLRPQNLKLDGVPLLHQARGQSRVGLEALGLGAGADEQAGGLARVPLEKCHNSLRQKKWACVRARMHTKTHAERENTSGHALDAESRLHA